MQPHWLQDQLIDEIGKILASERFRHTTSHEIMIIGIGKGRSRLEE